MLLKETFASDYGQETSKYGWFSRWTAKRAKWFHHDVGTTQFGSTGEITFEFKKQKQA